MPVSEFVATSVLALSRPVKGLLVVDLRHAADQTNEAAMWAIFMQLVQG